MEFFKKFAIECVKQFDCEETRILNEHIPIDYLAELQHISAEILRISGISHEEGIAEYAGIYLSELKEWQEAEDEKECRFSALSEIKEKAMQWIAPTNSHKELRSFMINEINKEILGCFNLLGEKPIPKFETGEDYIDYTLQYLREKFNDLSTNMRAKMERLKVAQKWQDDFESSIQHL